MYVFIQKKWFILRYLNTSHGVSSWSFLRPMSCPPYTGIKLNESQIFCGQSVTETTDLLFT